MSSQSSIPWLDEFIGVAYRYFDLRMNVVPLSPNDSSIVPSAFTLVTLASGPPNVTHVIPPIKILPSS